jgi:hypothetical protein
MDTIGRLRFYAYTALIVVVGVLVPTPDPVPYFAISAEVIGGCEVAYWLARALHRRGQRVSVVCFSVSLILLVLLLATTIQREVRRWHELSELTRKL